MSYLYNENTSKKGCKRLLVHFFGAFFPAHKKRSLFGIQGPDNQKLFSSGYRDSNPGPPTPEAGALTGLRYTPYRFGCRLKSLVGVPGFEPGTPCSQSRCANRTALHPVCLSVPQRRRKCKLFFCIYKQKNEFSAR